MSQPGSEAQFSFEVFSSDLRATGCARQATQLLVAHAVDVVSTVAPELDDTLEAAYELGIGVHGLIQHIPEIPWSPRQSAARITNVTRRYLFVAANQVCRSNGDVLISPDWASAFAGAASGPEYPARQKYMRLLAYNWFLPTSLL